MIRKVKLDDNLEDVARLIYTTEEAIFNSLMGNMKKALPRIVDLIKLENNEYSYKNIYCYDDNGIKGILIIHDYSKMNQRERDWDYMKTFPLIPLIHMGMKYEQLKKIITEKDQGYYIDILSVNSTCRGQGIGSSLLSHVLKEYENESGQIFLDVTIGNIGAKRLYQKMGFVEDKTSILNSHGVGAYSMKYVK